MVLEPAKRDPWIEGFLGVPRGPWGSLGLLGATARRPAVTHQFSAEQQQPV